MKLWADPYGFLTGEIKGGQISLNYKYLYVTSNYTIEQCVNHCFPNDE